MGLQPDWYEQVYEILDLRSFSNLWYWLAVAVVWSWASHFVLGVPYDMVQRARRLGGQAERDMESLVRIHVNRMIAIESAAGGWIPGIAAFVLTVLGLLGFFYGIEFAQAVFLIAAPMTPVAFLSLRTARAIDSAALAGEALRRRIGKTRLIIQAIGLFSIFLTALWGMYQNTTVGPLLG